MIRRVVVVLLSMGFLVVGVSDAAAKSWWGWLEEFSGPGPFRTRGPLQTLHFTAMCAAEDEVDYHAVDAAASLLSADLRQYLENVLKPLREKFPDVPLVVPPVPPPAPPIAAPGVDLLFLTPGGATQMGRLAQPSSGESGVGVTPVAPANAPGAEAAGVLGQSAPAPRLTAISAFQGGDRAGSEFLIAETVIKRSPQALGTPLPFRSVEAESIRTRLLARRISYVVPRPRLNRNYCLYVDYGRFFADADPIQGYPAIRASKLDVGLAYLIMGPLDISAAAGFIRFTPAQTEPAFRWTFTPFRLQVRPLAWMEKYVPNQGVGRRLARIAYAPKLYVKQTALLRSISASEFGSQMLQPDGTEFKTGPELVSSYGFAVDLTEIAAALFQND